MTPGDRLLKLVQELQNESDQLVVLARHSAREFNRDRHDLLNPLTDEGRGFATRLGEALPPGLYVRGYASPPSRCMETAELVLAGYAGAGGSVGRHRPVEGLGVFYALDQIRMWKALSGVADPGSGGPGAGLAAFVRAWGAGELTADTMMPADVAARMVLRLLVGKLDQQAADPHLDLCISHDLTIMMLRQELLGMEASSWPVEFLDGVALMKQADRLWLISDTGHRQDVTAIAR